MYPFIRLAAVIMKNRRAPAIGLTDLLESQHICWPWDLDIWRELNNGRSLTLYDLGRTPLAMRSGLFPALLKNRWGLTMAGVSVRWRRRVRMFERITIRSRTLCWDDRFIYLEQSMWTSDGVCASHVLYRIAVTDPQGIVATARVMQAIGGDTSSPETPDWVANWIAADATRPWPPMQE